MKKIMLLSIIGVVFCMVSVATAVPTIQSQPIMKTIEKYEKSELNIKSNLGSLGIISSIIAFIILFIKLVLKVLAIYRNIETIINLIQRLFVNIQELIDLIRNILNPEEPASQTF